MSLSVVHFSDIHIKSEADLVFQRVNAIKSACVSSLPNNGDVVIIISGDIAFSGQPHQYELARKLIDCISEYIIEQKGSRVRFAFSPGNHDCDFSKETSVRNTLIESARGTDIDIDYYHQVNAIQGSFDVFAEAYGISTNSVLRHLEVETGENKVLFLLANTAWMSVLEEKPGKIIIPSHLFESIDAAKYKAVFCVLHHPTNWLDPDCKRGFIDYIRKNADIIMIGHEHSRDSYEQRGSSFSVYCSHGKELQDSKSEASAFSVINFDNAFQNFDVIDFSWDGHIYNRIHEATTHQYHKNISAKKNAVTPNIESIKSANDMGLLVSHFAKDTVSLPDLFVWPDFSKSDFCNEKAGNHIIRSGIIEELNENSLNILIGSSSSGKTAIAKTMFLTEEASDSCCLLVHGSCFSSSAEADIRSVIEKEYINEYSKDYLEEFRQLPKELRSIIVDDFDLIKDSKGRRSAVLDYICGFFGKVTILLSSTLELTTLLRSTTLAGVEHVIYYEILPLGNRKRKQMISMWYHLNEFSLSEEEIEEKVDSAIEKINIFLGSGNGFLPAMPVFIIGSLQNLDAVQPTYAGSKYGFLYQSLITHSLSRISPDYLSAGNYDIDIGILSNLSFNMLLDKKRSFTLEQVENIVTGINRKHLLHLSNEQFLQRMIEGKIVFSDGDNCGTYRFMYPYIFYYFCGYYIAYHLEDKGVQNYVEYMSSRLYNEAYGNIIIFVCHFANNSDVIDSVLLNAYDTLSNYTAFDFAASNPVFEDIKDAVEALIPKTIATSEEEINENREKRLAKMDEIGINDGQVTNSGDTIDDEVSDKEKDIASVVAALKTIEVLGEILQNYPMGFDGERKIEIIDEIHKLGMRAVQAIINTMGFLERDLVEFLYERASKQRKQVSKDDVARATRQFIKFLVSSMARGMVHQVATALNSSHLLKAAQISFNQDSSISSKLVLLDLKLNCLNTCDYSEISGMKKEFDSKGERFASRILDSIVGQYLNYNRCDNQLRSRLCSLCGLSQQNSLLATERNLL